MRMMMVLITMATTMAMTMTTKMWRDNDMLSLLRINLSVRKMYEVPLSQEDEDATETVGAKIGVEEAYSEQVEDDSLFLEKE